MQSAGIFIKDTDGKQVDLYALRTTYTTNLLRTGATASEARHATRHSSTQVLDEHYNRLNLEDTRRMVDQLSEIHFTCDRTSQADATGELPNVAHNVALDPLQSTLDSIDWLDEGTKALLAYYACSLYVNRYNTVTCTDRQHGAPIDIKDVCESFKERDSRAHSSVG